MNAKEILELYEQLSGDGGAQTKEDKRIDQLLQRLSPVRSGHPQDEQNPVRRIAAGHAGLSINQGFSLLSAPPFISFHADDKQKKHAEKLEAAASAMWDLSQGEIPVYQNGVYDYIRIGRCVSKVCYYPDLWAFDEIGDGEDKDEYNEKTARWQEEAWPILWRYVDPRSFKRTTLVTGAIDQSVEHLKLSVRAARLAYKGVDFRKKKDHDEIDVYIYADDKKMQTIVDPGKAPQETDKDWEHGLTVHPYVMAALPRTAPEGDGIEFRGSLFHVKDMIDAEEALISDIHYGIRMSAQNAWKVLTSPNVDPPVDPEAEEVKLEVKPRAVLNLPPGKDIVPLEAAKVNEQSFQLLNFLQVNIASVAFSETLMGILASGQSGTGYNTAVQTAERQYGPATENLRKYARGVVERMFRSVEAFGEEIPIYYTTGDGKMVSMKIGPKDVTGWSRRSQARIELAIKQNENAQFEIWRLTQTEPKLASWDTGAERWGGIQNPIAERRAIRKDNIRAGLDPSLLKFVQENGLKLLSQQGADFTGIDGLPPEVMAGIQQMGQQQGVTDNGQNARSMANQVRENVPQNLSKITEQNGY